MHYLSIISPFYNSEKKCHRLLSTLYKIQDKGIEIILVDDGSTDNTINLLRKFKKGSDIDVAVITQENKGPGGARNAGLKVAKGKYVWFVDSDDDIELKAVSEIKEYSKMNYDFIDFNYISQGVSDNSMDFDSGTYYVDDRIRELLLKKFGRIWTKVIRKDAIIKNSIFYPEYCIYEDNPFIFIYPFITSKFIKSETIAYSYNTDLPSVTRDKPSPKFFDRLHTAVYGFNKGRELAKTSKEQSIIEKKFIGLYLINTVAGLSSLTPSKNWYATHMVMKQFRILEKNFGIHEYYNTVLNDKSVKFKTYFLFHWYLSKLTIGNSSKFIEKQRLKAWNKPFSA